MVDKLYFDTSEANNLDKNTRFDASSAKPYNVKQDYIFKDTKTQEILSGTMPINPDDIIKIDPHIENISNNNSYTIPLGYHSGNGKVVVGDLEEYTFATAEPKYIAKNKTAWVNGEKIVGTLDLDENDQVGTATENDILSGEVAWVNRKKIIGNIPRIPRQDKILSGGESYTIPYGLSPGTMIISAKSLEDQTTGTADSESILKGKIAWVNGEKITGTFDFDEEIKNRFEGTDATPSDVIEGRKFYSNESGMKEGTMPDHSGEPTRELRPGQLFTIPEGYYNGLVSVQVQSLEDATIANALAKDILSTKTAWVNGQKITGTMVQNQAKSITIDAGETYTIPSGNHTGSGKVIAKSLSDQTQATAIANEIRNGKTAWVNGEKITGSMNDNPPEEVILDPGESYTIQSGYHTGSGYVYTHPIQDLTPGTAIPDNILLSKTAWVNGEQLTGTMTDNGSWSRMDVGSDTTITIPKGYHSGTGTIKTKSLEDLTPGTANASDILKNSIAWANGEKIVGTLELTGTADAYDVLAGKSFYNYNAKTKLNGTLVIDGDASDSDVLFGKTFFADDPHSKKTGTLKLTGTANSDNVLSGYSFYNTNPKESVTGSIPIIPPSTIEINHDEEYLIPKGYHNGTGKVISGGLGPVTPGTAIESDILKYKTAWVNGKQLTGTLELTGNAVSDDVLSNTTFYSDNPNQKLTGTMSNNGSWSKTDVESDTTVTIPKGYHDGTGTIKTKSLSDQTQATAIADEILNEKTAWINGEKIEGTMPNNGSWSKTDVGSDVTITIPKGYHDGTGTIKTAHGQSTEGTATESDLIKDKTAWVNGEQLIGTMPNNGSWSKTDVDPDALIEVPKGYHDGTGVIKTKSLEDLTPGDSISANILLSKTAWVNGIQLTGTMPNNGSWSKTDVGSDATITIPKGYHDGTGTIKTAHGQSTEGTAIEADILLSKTAWVNGEQLTGTMPNNGSWSKTDVGSGITVAIPKGYHNGDGYIETKSLNDMTPGTAISNNILLSKTAWVNGEQLTGTMPNNGSWSRTDVGSDATITIPMGYHDGTGTIKTAHGQSTEGTATDDDILLSKTAWVNGEKLSGTMPNNGSWSKTDVDPDALIEVPKGYHDGTGIIKTKSLEDSTPGDSVSANILLSKTAWVNGEKITGTMPNNGSWSKTDVGSDATITIPMGYHDGTGTIKTAHGQSTEGTATESDLIKDKTAWVNGEKITGTLELTGNTTVDNVLLGYSFYGTDPKQKLIGTMPNNGSWSKTDVGSDATIIIPKGYHDGTGYVKTAHGQSTEGTATDTDIIKDKTAWVNGEKITGTLELTGTAVSDTVLSGYSFYGTDPNEKLTGTMPNNGSWSRTNVGSDATITIPKGYHDGTGTIKTAHGQSTEGTATGDDILLSKTAWVNGEQLTGTMPNNDAWIYTNVNPNTTINIPKGYHNGLGYIKTKSIQDLTPGTATSDNILISKTAWVNGIQLYGTMPNNGSWSRTDVGSDATITIPRGYHDGTGTIKTAHGQSTEGTATESDILKDKTAWVNGEKITGTIETRSTDTVRINAGHDIVLPAGYYPNGIHIYALYPEMLDLTGTDASNDGIYLNTNGTGYKDNNELVVTEIPL